MSQFAFLRGEWTAVFAQVSRRSLQRDLKLLLDKGLIEPMGAAAVTDPNRSYVPGRAAAPPAGRRGRQ